MNDRYAVEWRPIELDSWSRYKEDFDSLDDAEWYAKYLALVKHRGWITQTRIVKLSVLK